ncbi:MAG: transglycosylase SLT domain-containing protein [Rhizobiales bacterium]|nr:transglycosylase SLT domain-containing protein [Hyphomicrobiales bacterium]
MVTSIDKNAPAGPVTRSGGTLDQVLRRAAAESGVDFRYLLKTAERESSLNPGVVSTTSSATGLFQFIEQTWLSTIRSDGEELGFGRYARGIERGADGTLFVRDQGLRRDILALRKDPEISAKVAAALTRRNAEYLSNAIGREATGGELYIAHFLGAKGASDLLTANSLSPQRPAAELFPQAAAANKAIFYDGGGAPRSVGQVHALLTARHDATRGANVISASRPDPAATLASHTRGPAEDAGGGNGSSDLASGAQAAFLASHFSGLVNAFVAEPSSTNGIFGEVLGSPASASQRSFFAPEVTQGARAPAPRTGDADVIPSRYGRTEEEISVTKGESPSLPLAQPRLDASGREAVVSAYSATQSPEPRTVIVRSSEFGKIEPPLDFARFLKAVRGK